MPAIGIVLSFTRNGYRDMALIDLLEMLSDCAECLPEAQCGAYSASIVINQNRFGHSEELATIFRNTIAWLETQPVYPWRSES